MQCPFLKQTKVRYCELSPIRKMLTDTDGFEQYERCSTAQYRDCPLLKNADPYPHDLGNEDHCPRLRTAMVQYCDTAGVRKLVPYHDCLLSRCQTDAHLYCPVYRQRENPKERVGVESSATDDEVNMPAHISYWPNHMWMHEAEFGVCHIGVDAFVACVLGSVDQVKFISPRTLTQPTAVLEVHGHELRFVFPEKIEITGSNVHLLTHPEEIIKDPYGSGWLYEGRVRRAESRTPVERGAIDDIENRDWMRHEVERLDRFVRDEVHASEDSSVELATDGGHPASGLMEHLGPDEGLELLRRFFTLSPQEAK